MPLPPLVGDSDEHRSARTAEYIYRGFKLGSRVEGRDDERQRRVRSVLADTGVLHGSEVPANLLSSRPELEVLKEDNENRLCGRDEMLVLRPA